MAIFSTYPCTYVEFITSLPRQLQVYIAQRFHEITANAMGSEWGGSIKKPKNTIVLIVDIFWKNTYLYK